MWEYYRILNITLRPTRETSRGHFGEYLHDRPKCFVTLCFFNCPQFFVNQDSLAGINCVVRLPLTSRIKDQSMVHLMQLYACREAALRYWIFLTFPPLEQHYGSAVYRKSYTIEPQHVTKGQGMRKIQNQSAASLQVCSCICWTILWSLIQLVKGSLTT